MSGDHNMPGEDRRFDVSQQSWADDIKELAVQKYAADNCRLLLDEADHEYAAMKAERDAALELLSEALYALEYGVDMTKPEGMSWCDCPSCTVIPKIRKLMKNIHVVRDVAR